MFNAIKRALGMATFPSKEWCSNATNATKFTPDIVKLELAEYQLLFVADDMQRASEAYSEIAEHSAFICKGFTSEPYNYFIHIPTGTPVPIKAKLTSSAVNEGPIYGELHALKSYHFTKLDKLRQNGVQFTRSRIKVIIPWRDQYVRATRSRKRLPEHLIHLSEEHLTEVEAWFYSGKKEFWLKKIKSDLFVSGLHKEFREVKRQKPLKEKQWLSPYFHLKPPD